MKTKNILLATLTFSMLGGCASGLNSAQEREYQAFKHNSVLVEEKNPTTGAVLGILPGGGSFYAGEIGLGVVNLLLWPASIFWDPVSGHSGSKAINYDITKQQLQKDKNKELSLLDDKLSLGEVDTTEYVLAKRKVEEKYTFD